MSDPEARLRLRPTMLSDLDYVISVENDEHNQPFITPWERTQHEGAVRFPDFRHFIIESTHANIECLCRFFPFMVILNR